MRDLKSAIRDSEFVIRDSGCRIRISGVGSARHSTWDMMYVFPTPERPCTTKALPTRFGYNSASFSIVLHE